MILSHTNLYPLFDDVYYFVSGDIIHELSVSARVMQRALGYPSNLVNIKSIIINRRDDGGRE